MFTETMGEACSSCSSTSRPFVSVCLVNGMFTNARSNSCSWDGRERDGGRPLVARDRYLGGEPLGRRNKCMRGRRAGIADKKRHARVTAFADRLIDRDAADERHAEILRHPLPAALPEDVRFVLAVRADEVAHVLENADRRDVQLLV